MAVVRAARDAAAARVGQTRLALGATISLAQQVEEVDNSNQSAVDEVDVAGAAMRASRLRSAA